MRKKAAIIVAVILLALPVLAAFTLYQHFTYYTFTGTEATVAWGPVTNATQYRYEAVNVERGNTAFVTGTTSQSQVTFVIPNTGHWIFRVRAINAEGESEWASSDLVEYAEVGGQPQSWWIFAWIAPPTAPEIE